MLWVEARNATKYSTVCGRVPTMKNYWPKMSTVPKLRSPALSIAFFPHWRTSGTHMFQRYLHLFNLQIILWVEPPAFYHKCTPLVMVLGLQLMALWALLVREFPNKLNPGSCRLGLHLTVYMGDLVGLRRIQGLSWFGISQDDSTSRIDWPLLWGFFRNWNKK